MNYEKKQVNRYLSFRTAYCCKNRIKCYSIPDRFGLSMLPVIMLPGNLAGYLFTNLFGKDNNITIFCDRKRWWGFAAGILIVTTLFWLFEKFVF